MNKSIEFEGIAVEVIYTPQRKHSYLRVNADSTISVKTPLRSQKFVYTFLEEKRAWIKKQLEKNRTAIAVNLEDEVLLFGEVYSIDLDTFAPLRKKLQKLSTKDTEKILRAYNSYYKEIAQEYLTQRTQYFALSMRLKYNELRFRKMKSRWGSCSSQKNITFNTQLVKLKKEYIDYVIVHELAHLVHMNHSKKFHQLVASYLPNAAQLRKALRETRLLD